MMDRDTITRTGARAPGAKRQWPLERCVPAHRAPRLRTRKWCYRQRGARRTEANRALRRSRSRREGPSDIPAFQPDWGKPTVRNDRGDHGNGGIIRSPIRAMVLPGKIRAAMLGAALAGESPVGGNCSVATVVISGSGASDQAAGSPEVKVSVGKRETSGQLRQGGERVGRL